MKIINSYDAYVATSEISWPVRLGGPLVLFSSDHGGAACDPSCGVSLLAAATLTYRTVSDGSEHLDVRKGTSDAVFAGFRSDMYGRVLPCMNAARASRLSDMLADVMLKKVYRLGSVCVCRVC